jgi:hypothetical protein
MDHELQRLSERIGAAIAARDTATLRGILAPGFTYRSHEGERADGEQFLTGVEHTPGEIVFVRLERLHIDECPTGALVTGVQHAQVVVDGDRIDDRRNFVDWFTKIDDEWRLQAAVDYPVFEEPS